MSRAKLAAAGELYREGNYQLAYDVLLSISDPALRDQVERARKKVEMKLTKVAPVPLPAQSEWPPAETFVSQTPIKSLKPKPVGRRRFVLGFILTIGIIGILGLGLLVVIGLITLPSSAICAYSDEQRKTITQFLDTAQIATTTSRMSLSTVLLDMQKIYRDFEAMNPPACLDEPSTSIRVAMDFTIRGFQAFQAQNDSLAGIYLGIATKDFKEAYDTAQKISPLAFIDVRAVNTKSIWGY